MGQDCGSSSRSDKQWTPRRVRRWVGHVLVVLSTILAAAITCLWMTSPPIRPPFWQDVRQLEGGSTRRTSVYYQIEHLYFTTDDRGRAPATLEDWHFVTETHINLGVARYRAGRLKKIPSGNWAGNWRELRINLIPLSLVLYVPLVIRLIRFAHRRTQESRRGFEVLHP